MPAPRDYHGRLDCLDLWISSLLDLGLPDVNSTLGGVMSKFMVCLCLVIIYAILGYEMTKPVWIALARLVAAWTNFTGLEWVP